MSLLQLSQAQKSDFRSLLRQFLGEGWTMDPCFGDREAGRYSWTGWEGDLGGAESSTQVLVPPLNVKPLALALGGRSVQASQDCFPITAALAYLS